MHRAWWLGLSGPERAQWWLGRAQLMLQLRYDLLRREHPEASDDELRARWIDVTYRNDANPDYLRRVVAAVAAGQDAFAP